MPSCLQQSRVHLALLHDRSPSCLSACTALFVSPWMAIYLVRYREVVSKLLSVLASRVERHQACYRVTWKSEGSLGDQSNWSLSQARKRRSGLFGASKRTGHGNLLEELYRPPCSKVNGRPSSHQRLSSMTLDDPTPRLSVRPLLLITRYSCERRTLFALVM